MKIPNWKYALVVWLGVSTIVAMLFGIIWSILILVVWLVGSAIVDFMRNTSKNL